MKTTFVLILSLFIANLLYTQTIPFGTSTDSVETLVSSEEYGSWNNGCSLNTIITNYEVHYYKPQSYNSVNSPILWYVHGTGGSGADAESRLSDIADRKNALIVAPTLDNVDNNTWNSVRAVGRDSSGCSHIFWLVPVFTSIYKHILNRETRDSIDVYLTGFSMGGQFVSRYMLVRQHFLDSIPIKMAVSLSGASYTFCTDSLYGIEMPYRCGIAGSGSFPPFGCNNEVKQYYNENYGVLIGTNDTANFGTALPCLDVQGINRFERAENFYNFSDTNALSRGTTLNWIMDSIQGVGHNSFSLYSYTAAGDSIPVAERMLFETPYHPVPDFSPNVAFIYEDSALTVQFTDISQNVDSYWHWDFGDGDSSLIAN
ncbi:MAG: hypothetical protein ACP5DZ_10215, partial [Bacteroidales bacterium]